MSRLSRTAALLASAMTLAACGSVTNGPATNALNSLQNPSLYSVNQPVVQRTDYVLDLSSGGGGIGPAEMDRLAAWFDSIGLQYGDRIHIDEPAGYGDPVAREDVARVVGDYGLFVSNGAPITAGAVQPGSVRVVVSRSSASVPGCPNWETGEINARITTAPNFGCATNSNLAAMVADPSDLVLGQAGSGRNADTVSKAIRAYRDAPTTGAGTTVKSESTGGQ